MITYINSPIKINLSLRVLARRDDGYHDIRTIFWRLTSPELVSVDDSADEDSVICVGANIIGENIVARAMHKLRANGTKLPHGLKITIYKHLAQGGGLGAGSGNAACILDMYRYLSGEDVMDIARELGADVSFLTSGYSVADAGGIGDELIPLGDGPRLAAVILMPTWTTSTADAYAQIDSRRERGLSRAISEEEAIRDGERVLDALRSGKDVGLLPNDFIDVQGDGVEWCEKLFDAAERSHAAAWGLCGSGSSCVCLFHADDDRGIRSLFKKIRKSDLSSAFVASMVCRGTPSGCAME